MHKPTHLLILALCILAGLTSSLQAATPPPTSTGIVPIGRDYSREMDQAILLYKRQSYAQSRQMFARLFNNTDDAGKVYRHNAVVLQWLMAAMIKSGAKPKEVMDLCTAVIRENPGGPAVKLAKGVYEDLRLKLKAPHPNSQAKNFDIEAYEANELSQKEKMTATPSAPPPSSSRQPDDYFRHGVIKFSNQEYAQALPLFTKALQLKAGFAEAYYFRGQCQRELKHCSQALEDYRRACDMGLAEACKNPCPVTGNPKPSATPSE